MLFISSRAKARSLAVLALAAAPLAVPVAANAAMGGANPVVSTATPNLRSATIQNVNTTNQTQDVEYCFDKPIGSQPQRGLLRIGDYDQGELVADSARQSSANCAVATYSNRRHRHPAVHLRHGRRHNAGAHQHQRQPNNIADSVALVGSTSNAGTRGVTTGPDLTGITVNNANSTHHLHLRPEGRRANGAGTALPAGDFQFQNQDGDSGGRPGGCRTGQLRRPTVVAGQGTTALDGAVPAGRPPAAGNPGAAPTSRPPSAQRSARACRPVSIASGTNTDDLNPAYQSAAASGLERQHEPSRICSRRPTSRHRARR